MNHVVQVNSLQCLFPDSGGVCFRIRARKPPGFFTSNFRLIFRTELVVKQVRASFHGQEFWSALNKVFGTALAATFRLTLHPIFLCPDHLDPSHFKFGKDEAIFDVFFNIFFFFIVTFPLRSDLAPLWE